MDKNTVNQFERYKKDVIDQMKEQERTLRRFEQLGLLSNPLTFKWDDFENKKKMESIMKKLKSINTFYIDSLKQIETQENPQKFMEMLMQWLDDQYDDSLINPTSYIPTIDLYDSISSVNVERQLSEPTKILLGRFKELLRKSHVPYSYISLNQSKSDSNGSQINATRDQKWYKDDWHDRLPQMQLVAHEYGTLQRAIYENEKNVRNEYLPILNKFDKFLDSYAEYLKIVNNHLELKRRSRKLYLFISQYIRAHNNH